MGIVRSISASEETALTLVSLGWAPTAGSTEELGPCSIPLHSQPSGRPAPLKWDKAGKLHNESHEVSTHLACPKTAFRSSDPPLTSTRKCTTIKHTIPYHTVSTEPSHPLATSTPRRPNPVAHDPHSISPTTPIPYVSSCINDWIYP